MDIQVKPDGKTSLYVSKAKFISPGLSLDATKTQVKSNSGIIISWSILVEAEGRYQVSLNLSACGDAEAFVCAGYDRINLQINPTRGYFNSPGLNFECLEFEKPIKLARGRNELLLTVKNNPETSISVSSVELYPESHLGIRMLEEAEARKSMANVNRYSKKGYGMMFHWTGETCPREGEPKNYELAVRDFDAEEFARQIERVGASYVFFTANHAVRHFPAPLPEWEKYYPGYTTKRDLLEDLYHSLSKRGIDLMLYLNFTAAYLESPYSGITSDNKGVIDYTKLDVSRREHFTRCCIDILNGIGGRYGKKISGYWIDSCYQLDQQFDGYNFKAIYESAKTGNPDRIVSFNYWILPVSTPWMDFWAGETARLTNIPGEAVPTYGPAKGHTFHELIIMENSWGHFEKNIPIPDPYYSADELAAFTRAVCGNGGMFTINAEVYQDGTMGEKTIDVLVKTKEILVKKQAL
ncbi:MAG: hypothetical protein GX754_02305 [Clostridiaceae bacterium]|nr:hypothetical protein [Clostridiaceae bacterium]